MVAVLFNNFDDGEDTTLLENLKKIIENTNNEVIKSILCEDIKNKSIR